jgi:hypothetical protein
VSDLFFFYSISSEYHTGRQNRPNLLGSERLEVAWNEGEHFRTVGEKLDKFSTKGGWVRSYECASPGGRIAQDRTWKALARRLFFAFMADP